MARIRCADERGEWMKASDAAKAALRAFHEIQVEAVQDVLIEGVQAPGKKAKDWRITIGYSPSRVVLGVAVSGERVRSVIRLDENGAFLGMRSEPSDDD